MYQGSKLPTSFTPVYRGSQYSADYRVYHKDGSGFVISPWHDIPLFADEEKKTVNMVCEIPRWTQAKMEIATKELLNPIKQDVKKGNLRFVHNCFPHVGYIWNYGALPQTWEDPSHTDPNTGARGDNDPIDVCEIGQKIAKRGAVIQVKILGTLAMIDEGETDWKLIAIDVTDPLAEKLNDIADVEVHCPGLLAATREWFRIYKIPAGSPENKFAFDGQFKDKAFASTVVDETHEFWRRLVASPQNTAGLSANAVSFPAAAQRVTPAEAETELNSKPEEKSDSEIPAHVCRWHYIQSKY